MSNGTIKCPYCGKKHPSHFQFCPESGKKINNKKTTYIFIIIFLFFVISACLFYFIKFIRQKENNIEETKSYITQHIEKKEYNIDNNIQEKVKTDKEKTINLSHEKNIDKLDHVKNKISEDNFEKESEIETKKLLIQEERNNKNENKNKKQLNKINIYKDIDKKLSNGLFNPSIIDLGKVYNEDVEIKQKIFINEDLINSDISFIEARLETDQLFKNIGINDLFIFDNLEIKTNNKYEITLYFKIPSESGLSNGEYKGILVFKRMEDLANVYISFIFKLFIRGG